MYNLFLDDIRVPYAPNCLNWDAFSYTNNLNYVNLDWVIVRSYDTFVKYIEKNGVPELISFDHDLADEHYNSLREPNDVDYNEYTEKTGYECVKWLCGYCIDNKEIPECLFHTQNIIGQINMSKYIENFKKHNGKNGKRK